VTKIGLVELAVGVNDHALPVGGCRTGDMALGASGVSAPPMSAGE